jgi:hypothetical protein
VVLFIHLLSQTKALSSASVKENMGNLVSIEWKEKASFFNLRK